MDSESQIEEPFWTFDDGQTVPPRYRGWTTILERRFEHVGKGVVQFWECRAYKDYEDSGEHIEAAVQPDDGRFEDDANADSDANIDFGYEDEVADIVTITPVRSLDVKAAYWEACARIDRLEASTVAEPGENSLDINATEVREANSTQTTPQDVLAATSGSNGEHEAAGQAEGVDGIEDDPLAAEFSTSAELVDLVERMANEANEADDKHQ